MSEETILVSAYMSDIFNVPGLDVEQYAKWAEPLLMLPKKKIIFIDSAVFYKIYDRPKHSSTILIPFDKKKLEAWKPLADQAHCEKWISGMENIWSSFLTCSDLRTMVII